MLGAELIAKVHGPGLRTGDAFQKELRPVPPCDATNLSHVVETPEVIRSRNLTPALCVPSSIAKLDFEYVAWVLDGEQNNCSVTARGCRLRASSDLDPRSVCSRRGAEFRKHHSNPRVYSAG